MKMLVTGAGGFLGSHIVQRCLDGGHSVRAMVRPATDTRRLDWEQKVEIVRADLRSPPDLTGAFEDVDVLVHLAAGITGDEQTQFASTVVGTERLLEAMSKSQTRRLVLAGSFSVYNFMTIGSRLTEASPVAEGRDLYLRDGYPIAKVWQERVARRFASQNEWDLRIVRPGFIWGRGRHWQAGMGMDMNGFYLVIAPFAILPLTHVENCADAFVHVAQHEGAVNQTFNLVDDHNIRTRKFLSDYVKVTGKRKWRIYVPYDLGLVCAHMAAGVSRMLFGPNGRLPSVLIPCRFRARFMKASCSSAKLRERTGWIPPFSYAQCLERTDLDSEEG